VTLLDDLTTLTTTWGDTPHTRDLRRILRRHTSPLTDAQQQTLTELANGATQHELAAAHGMTRAGANWRVGQIHTAYNVRSTTRAVVEAIRAGHLNLDDLEGEWGPEPPTPAQIRLLQAVADHGTSPAASAALGVTASAVNANLHRCSALAGTSSRVQIIVRAIKEEWIW
jgi:DNA-binding CsgD family transcriptional regulator